MDIVRIICVLYVFFFNRAPLLANPACDQGIPGHLQEGNAGESANFPWLGILRVHLHHGDELKIALTGLILVKDRYAIANADDVAKIPKTVFKTDSKAMFIPKTGEPWYTTLTDYMTHPEYEFSTYNTIALVELALEEGTKVPFMPICWPGYFFNTSNQLYALGYTDDNKLLEKTVYKLQYVKPSLCNEYYNRAGLTDQKMTPTHIQCGYATNNKLDCLWENGMALASNSSGRWTLIGLSIRGPSCSAPARFVDLFPYLPWIESATDLEEVRDYPDYRRTAFGEGFRRKEESKKEEILDVPMDDVNPRNNWKHGMEIDALWPYVIGRVDEDAIQIHKFDEKYEENPGDCSKYRNLVYRDQIRLVDKYSHGATATYKVSLYDMHMFGYSCVKVKVKSPYSSRVRLWYRSTIGAENTFEHLGVETPQEILKHYLPYKREPIPIPILNATESPAVKEQEIVEPWEPGKHLTPKFIAQTGDTEARNLNILFWFTYYLEATVDVFVFGLARPHWFVPRPTTEEPENNSTIDIAGTTTEKERNIRRWSHIYKTDFNTFTKKRPSINLRRLHQRYNSTTPKNPLNSPTTNKTTIRRRTLKKHRKPKEKVRVNPYRLQKAMLRQADRLAMG